MTLIEELSERQLKFQVAKRNKEDELTEIKNQLVNLETKKESLIAEGAPGKEVDAIYDEIDRLTKLKARRMEELESLPIKYKDSLIQDNEEIVSQYDQEVLEENKLIDAQIENLKKAISSYEQEAEKLRTLFSNQQDKASKIRELSKGAIVLGPALIDYCSEEDLIPNGVKLSDAIWFGRNMRLFEDQR